MYSKRPGTCATCAKFPIWLSGTPGLCCDSHISGAEPPPNLITGSGVNATGAASCNRGYCSRDPASTCGKGFKRRLDFRTLCAQRTMRPPSRPLETCGALHHAALVIGCEVVLVFRDRTLRGGGHQNPLAGPPPQKKGTCDGTPQTNAGTRRILMEGKGRGAVPGGRMVVGGGGGRSNMWWTCMHHPFHVDQTFLLAPLAPMEIMASATGALFQGPPSPSFGGLP